MGPSKAKVSVQSSRDARIAELKAEYCSESERECLTVDKLADWWVWLLVSVSNLAEGLVWGNYPWST